MHDHHETLRELRGPTRSLRNELPDTWARFLELHDAAMSDGEVPARLKETVVKRCGGCIAYHARAAARAGARPGEVAELLGVALLMDGGPATVFAPRAWDAFIQFCADEAVAKAVS